MNTGNAIKLLRKKAKIKQSELAKAAGISAVALSRIENGVTTPKKETFKKLCDALDVAPAIVAVMGVTREDVPEERRVVFDIFEPALKALAEAVLSDDGEATITSQEKETK